MSRILKGRRRLTYSKPINTVNDVKDAILQNNINHQVNKSDIKYLWDYYLGQQDVLNRQKDIRPNIKKNTVVNHAHQIVSFFSSYAFGEGTQYVKRGHNVYGMREDTSSDIAKLNAGLAFKDKQANDIELAKHFLATGVAYRSIFPENVTDVEELPVEMGVLNPTNTAVIYSTDIIPKPILAYSYVEEEHNGVKSFVYHIYTESKYWKLRSTIEDSILSFGEVILEQKLNIGYIPIIEYNANPEKQGVFEVVIPILNLINEVTSNRGEAVEQFVQAYWKFINADITEEDLVNFASSGVVSLKQGRDDRFPSDVDLIKQELDQNGVQSFIDDLTLRALQIVGVPDRRNSTGGSTGAANMTSNGWYDTDSKVTSLESIFVKSEKQFLKVLLSIVKRLSPSEAFVKTNLADIDIKFSRNKTDNILVKTQALSQLLSSGINPRIAIAVVGLFNDPEAVYEESKETLTEVLLAKQGEKDMPKENPNSSAETENTEGGE